MITTKESFNVQIWVGLKETTQYGDNHTIDEVREVCKEFVIDGDCVSITPTEFIYTNGSGKGVVIGFINYPRFPRTKEQIITRATKLAVNLAYSLNQYRVTITTPDNSIMIQNELLTDETR